MFAKNMNVKLLYELFTNLFSIFITNLNKLSHTHMCANLSLGNY